MKKYIFSAFFIIFIIIVSFTYYFYFSLHPADKLHICIDIAMDEKSYNPSKKEDIRTALNQIWDHDCQNEVKKYQKLILEERRKKDSTTVILFQYEDFEGVYQKFKETGVNHLIEEIYYEEK